MDEVCRACLGKNASVSVFSCDEGSGSGVPHSSKMRQCAGVVVSRGDGLPARLCTRCVADLARAFAFAQRCVATDRALRAAPLHHQQQQQPAHNQELEHFVEIDFSVKEELDRPDFNRENFEGEYDDNEFTFDERQDLVEPIVDIKSNEELCKDPSNIKKRVRRKVSRSKMGPIQCVVCGLMAVCRSAMETHMRTHTGERPYPCEACNLRFTTKGALKRHHIMNHSKRERKFTCETCGNSFYTRSDIITHMRIHTDEKPYTCLLCSKSFRQIASLIRHKRVHTGEKPFACSVCGRKFNDKNLVKKHMHVHSDERKFSCHLCNKAVKTKTALNAHMKLHSNDKQNVCNFCGMAFTMKGNLQTHIRRVHSEKSGQCSVCLKTFSDVAEHMRKHTGEKPFSCGACAQAFASKRALAHHTAFKHLNAGKFKCSASPPCASAFPTALMLQFHVLKQHAQHTPFVCAHCARGFYRPSDLSRHLRVAHAQTLIKVQIKTVDS